jgi:hypothetical protein
MEVNQITRQEIQDEAARVLNKLTVLLHPDSKEYVQCKEIREAVELAGIKIIEIYEKTS